MKKSVRADRAKPENITGSAHAWNSSILVPFDFSIESTRPLKSETAMARSSGAYLELIHFVEPLQIICDCGYGPVRRRKPNQTSIKKAGNAGPRSPTSRSRYLLEAIRSQQTCLRRDHLKLVTTAPTEALLFDLA